MRTNPSCFVLAIVFAVLSCCGARAVRAQDDAAAKPKPICFLNVSVVSMESEQVARGRAVIVEGDRITSIANAAVISLHPDTTIIDGEGLYLMPGLADMHVHAWTDDDSALFLANGVTTIRNMWGDASHLAREARAASGASNAPRIFTAGALLDGEPPIWPTSTVVTDPDAARAEVRQQHEDGFQFIKVYNRLKPEVYDAIVDEAAKVGIPVVGHVPDAVGLANVLRAKQTTIEHLSGYARACRSDDANDARGFGADLRLFDPAKLPGVVEATVAGETWNCPTLIVLERMMTGSDQVDALMARPETAYVGPMWTQQWEQRFATAPANRDDDQANARAIHGRIVKALRDGGAGILLGSDTPNPFVVPGFSIHEELALLVGAGLTPYQALRAGTLDAARYLGRDHQLGSVTVGKFADLVLLRDNPLEDVAHASAIVGVMTRGRWLDAAALQASLDVIETRNTGGGADGAPDPFAGMETPDDPANGWSAAYALTWGAFPAGNERLTINFTETGDTQFISQISYPMFGMKLTGALDPGEDGYGRGIVISGDGTEIIMSREDGKLLVVGLPDQEPILEDIDDDVQVSSMFLTMDLPVVERIRTLKVGETQVSKVRSLQMAPMMHMMSTEVTYTRQDDAAFEPGGDILMHVVATMMINGAEAKQHYWLDESPCPVRVVMESPQGSLNIDRTSLRRFEP